MAQNPSSSSNSSSGAHRVTESRHIMQWVVRQQCNSTIMAYSMDMWLCACWLFLCLWIYVENRSLLLFFFSHAHLTFPSYRCLHRIQNTIPLRVHRSYVFLTHTFAGISLSHRLFQMYTSMAQMRHATLTCAKRTDFFWGKSNWFETFLRSNWNTAEQCTV